MFLKKKIKGVFLDRDGVINIDKGYIKDFKNLKFRKGVLRGLKYLTENKFLIFVITNQAGIAKGVIKLKEFSILNRKFINFLKSKKIIITKIEFCPHHKEGIINKFKKSCKCRKPNNLMIKRIYKKWNIDRNQSFMLGDRISDKQCAKKSKLYFEYAKPDFFSQIKKICRKMEIN
tara:strand:+ start:58 stop:582 length:525 start_codon:yes stop_codon:yes gene_type:complete